MADNKIDYELTVIGDMLGDKRIIKESHVLRSKNIVKEILPQLKGKNVIAFGGPSGTGKSEVASVVGTMLKAAGKGVYVLSCDNYPHRPPTQNDANRMEIHKNGGVEALRNYLGTPNEIDFERLGNIMASFKKGEPTLTLRIMNTTPGSHRVENDALKVDFSKIDVMVLEGTWSHLVAGSDIRVFLLPPPEGTKAHRAERARDPINVFCEEVVLPIEGKKLDEISKRAHLVVSSDGTIKKQAV